MLRATAIARIKLKCQAASEPTLSDQEVSDILDAYAEVDITGLPPDDPAWVGTWDLAACYRQGWLIKAGKVASDVDYDVDGAKYSQSQMAALCMKQADAYSLTGTISLGADTTAEVA